MLLPGRYTAKLSSGGHSVCIVQIFCVPPLFEFYPELLFSNEICPGLYRGVLWATPTIGALAGAFAVFRKQTAAPAVVCASLRSLNGRVRGSSLYVGDLCLAIPC